MLKYIEREALKEDIKNHFKKLIDEGYVYDEIFDSNAEISRIIEAQPTADVAEVKHGKWIADRSSCVSVEFKCSKCSYSFVDGDPYAQCKLNYCPNCGAKMDKE
jgi:hypothetical protein